MTSQSQGKPSRNRTIWSGDSFTILLTEGADFWEAVVAGRFGIELARGKISNNSLSSFLLNNGILSLIPQAEKLQEQMKLVAS